jgi:DNA polymerase-3 subunit epsilon
MKNFIALDVETANRNRHSICSIGMIFVENGMIKDSLYQLINPEEHFDRMNMSIHHITPNDIKNAPTFDLFYHSIKQQISGSVLVAHNMMFDGSALNNNLSRYQIQPEVNPLLCTVQLSRKLISGLQSYSLKPLCQFLGIKLENHHNALDDALACAEIMLKLTRDYHLDDLETIYQKTGIVHGVMSPDEYSNPSAAKKKKQIKMGG